MQVYIAPFVCNTLFKIGTSDNPHKRMQSLSFKFNKHKVVIFDCYDQSTSLRLESLLHSLCHHKREIQKGIGGTEVFEMTAFDTALGVARFFAEMNHCTEIQYQSLLNYSESEHKLHEVGQSLRLKLIGTRMKCRLSQEKLAELIGISRRTISRFENGENMDVDTFLKILAGIGVLEKFEENINQW